MKIYNTKLFKLLLLLFIISFVLGMISYFFIDTSYIKTSFIDYINFFNSNSFNYLGGLFKSLYFNYKYLFLIWISGILLLSFIIIPFLIIYFGLIYGISFMSLISIYHLKGFLYAFLLIFPSICINMLIYIICGYFSIKINHKLFNIIKNNKSIVINVFFKNYFYKLLIYIFILFISSLIEVFISSNLIKFVV